MSTIRRYLIVDAMNGETRLVKRWPASLAVTEVYFPIDIRMPEPTTRRQPDILLDMSAMTVPDVEVSKPVFPEDDHE